MTSDRLRIRLVNKLSRGDRAKKALVFPRLASTADFFSSYRDLEAWSHATDFKRLHHGQTSRAVFRFISRDFIHNKVETRARIYIKLLSVNVFSFLSHQ